MTLPKAAIDEFIALYQKHFHISLSVEEATKLAYRWYRFYSTVVSGEVSK